MNNQFIKLLIEGYAKNRDIAVEGLIFKAAMNRPYLLYLECHYNGADRIKTSDIIGKKATVILQDKQDTRYFNGYISDLIQDNEFGDDGKLISKSLSIIVSPTLAFLDKIRSCRVFGKGHVVEYLKKVASNYDIDLKEPGRPDFVDREYCVQYKESDLNFINRLLESEGIFYYFIQDKSTNTMVLGSNITDYRKDKPVIIGKKQGEYDLSHISQWDSALVGQRTSNDYDFNSPKKSLKSDNNKSRSENILQLGDAADYLYPYLVRSYSDSENNTVDIGKKYSDLILDAEQTNYGSINIELHGVWWGVDVGSRIKLHGQQGEYVITGVYLEIHDDNSDHGINNILTKLTVIDSENIYRPLMRTPVPDIPVQTATVVGTSDGTVFNKTDKGDDKQIFAKVKFHWDIEHSKDSNECSCWIRAGQAWAGNQRGFVFTPRVGDEVVVAFESSHPDVPLIIGGVHNGKNKVPYSLNDNKNTTGIVSTTIGDENSRSSAILFKDDKGEEEFSLLTKGKQINVVGKDSLRQVDGSVTEHIKSNISQTVDGDVQQKVGGKFLVEASQMIAFKVGGNFFQLGPEGITMMGAQVLENSGGEAPEVNPESLPNQTPIV